MLTLGTQFDVEVVANACPVSRWLSVASLANDLAQRVQIQMQKERGRGITLVFAKLDGDLCNGSEVGL